jgi:hypothetical protein
LFEKLTPFEFCNVRVWKVELASAENAGREVECIALLVIALVLEVNCSACVILRDPALLLKLIPFESWKTIVWKVDDASAEKAWFDCVAEMTTEPPVIPTLTMPSARKIRLEAFDVPLDDWVVFPVANIVIC